MKSSYLTVLLSVLLLCPPCDGWQRFVSLLLDTDDTEFITSALMDCNFVDIVFICDSNDDGCWKIEDNLDYYINSTRYIYVYVCLCVYLAS